MEVGMNMDECRERHKREAPRLERERIDAETQKRNEFHKQVFLAVLPVIVRTTEDTVMAAQDALAYADEAVRQYRVGEGD